MGYVASRERGRRRSFLFPVSSVSYVPNALTLAYNLFFPRVRWLVAGLLGERSSPIDGSFGREGDGPRRERGRKLVGMEGRFG
jgi:hypothetical protein